MFERSYAVAHGTGMPNLTTEHFLQYSGDNVDHNMRRNGVSWYSYNTMVAPKY